MFIFIYPIVTVVIALIMKKRHGRYPIMVALSMITSILSLFLFIISVLDDIYLSLEYIPLIKIVESLHSFSILCLFLHFVWPYRFKIANASVSLLRFLIVNQLILAILLLFTTYIYSFLTDKTIIINIGYLLSSILFSIFVIRLAFRYVQSNTTIALWLLALISIVSAIFDKTIGGYEVNMINIINVVTNISAITFFVIALIKILKRLFKKDTVR